MKARYIKYLLNFKVPGGTSRGILTEKETWFLLLQQGNSVGIGECGIFRGLSYDDLPDYEEKLKWVCSNIHLGKDQLLKELAEYPSIQFGLEQAMLSLGSENPFVLFPSDFTADQDTIPINGLIWMGDLDFMQQQIRDKIEQGFKCLKLKIGALSFDAELELLGQIRKEYSAEHLELRVDANGAFHPEQALEKLKALARLDLHSIEQPIKPGNTEVMSVLCAESPLPIALDEELIGITDVTKKAQLLQTIKPQFIILKPGLVGGYSGSEEWIGLAEGLDIGWWITSALESNIGLNAIAQWTYTLGVGMPQGLGTGALFTNNIESPLAVEEGSLRYKQDSSWNTEVISKLCI
ncbi:o-succinylbenzoate synthase [Lentiprolixibacter aurantiacus]|uniref:O-succinylbenzoate synthase n=1 Tax=Lentiprolixibacter aurantiacus TaxID=2993939 RepID=A0AAE3SNR0_9FLAO|nr:o-succinylbenzoate synthase [Lentiprolixibacter aurantiacus]MCX2719446.1 o-succinylbenzoate synthase [Lentiprolixibacter aurantiacus]